MSRVAKAPVLLPSHVKAEIDQQVLTITGPKGTLRHHYNALVKVTQSDEKEPKLIFGPSSNDPNAWAQAGTLRALANNMVKGVTVGFDVTLELVGVGYRAQLKPGVISLSLGLSHSVEHVLPEDVTAEVPNNTTIVLRGIDKQRVTQVAADIRKYRKPEPYKGKGIRYLGEVIVLKEAKKK